MKLHEFRKLIREEIRNTLQNKRRESFLNEANTVTIKLNVPGYRETIEITDEDDIKDYKKMWRNENDFGRDLYDDRPSMEHTVALRIYDSAKKTK
jgi:hypothetical protein